MATMDSGARTLTSLDSGDTDNDPLHAISEHQELASLTSEIAVALTTNPNLRSALRSCMEAVVRHLDAAFARVWTLTQGDSVLRLQASAGMYTAIDGTHSCVPVGKFKIGLIAQKRQPHFTNAVIGDPRIHDQDWARREGMIAFAGHPLIVKDRVVGVMALFSRHVLSTATVNALATVSHFIAAGIAHWQIVDALRTSEERFSLAMQASNEGIWDWDVLRDEAYLSPQFKQLIGESRDVIGCALDWFKFLLHPSDCDETLAKLHNHLEHKSEYRADCRLLDAKSQDYQWFHVRGQAMWDDRGRATRMLGSILEINERKRSEARRAAIHRVTRMLAETTELQSALDGILKTLCEALGWSVGGFWSVDNESQVLRCREFWHSSNTSTADFEAVSRNYTFPAGEGLPGRAWSSASTVWIEDVVQDSNFPRAKSASRCGLHGGLAFPIICDGKVFGVMEFLSRKIPEPDKDLLDLIEDISSQFSRHISLCKTRQISELQRQELAIAVKEKEASRHKDTFLATLAHELRNPLSPISNALQLWSLSSRDPLELERLRRIMERQVQHLVSLINDLMDVSRISGGKVRLDRRTLDLGTAMSHAVEAIQPTVDLRRQQLVWNPPGEPITVTADATRLHQVFVNVLGNACKFTGEGGIIHFTGESRARSSFNTDSEGGQSPFARKTAQKGTVPDGFETASNLAVVTVRDNGPGISPEVLPKVFQMFWQVDQTLERSHGGLGIGLSLADEIVRMHGGSIEARSAGLGHGAEFIITLPIAVEPSNSKPATVLPHADNLRAGLVERRIAVIDDWKEIADTLAMMLRAMGQEVVALADGKSIIDWVRTHHTDIAIIDISMPGMNGYQIARFIRQLPELDDLILVAMTGFGQEKDCQEAFEAGFDHHLTKPVDLATLQQLLSNLSVNARRDNHNLHIAQSC